MRFTVVSSVVLVLATACTTQPDRQPGAAAPVGDPSRSPSAAPSVPVSPVSSPPTSAPTTPAPSTTAPRDESPAGTGVAEIRKTDWGNVTVHGLKFCQSGGGTVRFRDGSNGLDIPCLMLPHGARPVYADFLTEEPANAPATEDALVLVELGNPDAARRQALVPIQIDTDGRTRNAGLAILGDQPSAAGDRVMTFTAYRVDTSDRVIATVRTLDGRTETRRYRQDSGGWVRF